MKTQIKTETDDRERENRERQRERRGRGVVEIISKKCRLQKRNGIWSERVGGKRESERKLMIRVEREREKGIVKVE